MGIGARLRALDDRVVRPRAGPTAHRRLFLLGVVGVLGVLLVVVLTGRTAFVGGIGGFAGVLLGGAGRWWAGERTDRRRMRRTVGAGAALVVVASALTVLTHDRWADPPRSPALQVPEPTQLVQCDATPQGRAYAYQPPASEVPRCENGAEPRVLLRP